MSDFLETMRAGSIERVARARPRRPLDELVAAARDLPAPPPLSRHPGGFDLIAEVKRSSPALGELSRASGDALVERAIAYGEAGAAAVSVLTEPERFGGELEHLRIIAAALQPLGVPAMRKDFIVDVYQVWEAAAAGAGGVLLILRLLDDATIGAMQEIADRTGMFVLLEAFDAEDLRRARRLIGAHESTLVGLNCRDLTSLAVDFERFAALAAQFPPDCVRVAESGIGDPQQAGAVAASGYAVALVGTALMRDADPGRAVGEMLRAGRAQARR